MGGGKSGQGVNLLTSEESAWENVGIDFASGIFDGKNNNRLKMKEKIFIQPGPKYTLSIFNTGEIKYAHTAFYYGEDNSYIGNSGIKEQSPFTLELPKRTAYIYIVLRHVGGVSEIKPSELNSVRIKLEIGAIENPIWTPSPDDFIDLKARVAALENK